MSKKERTAENTKGATLPSKNGTFGPVRVYAKRNEYKDEDKDGKGEDMWAIFKDLPLGIAILDKDRNVTYSNPMFRKILRMKKAEMGSGRFNSLNYIRPDGSSMPMEEMAIELALTQKRSARNVETGIVLDSGEVIWTTVSATPFPEGKGVLITMVEIIDRKWVHHPGIDADIIYQRLFESSKDGMVIIDALTGEIDDVNPSLLDIMDCSREQLVGKKMWEIGFFKNVVANKTNFKKLKEKGYIRYDDMPLETAFGDQKSVEFTSNIYQVGQKKVITCNIMDITDRKRFTDIIKLRLRLSDHASISTAETFLNRAMDDICVFTHSSQCFFYSIDEDTKTISFLACSTNINHGSRGSECKIMKFRIDRDLLLSECVRERRPIIQNELVHSKDQKKTLPGHSMIFRKMLIPILRNDKLVAMAYLENKTRPYSEQDLEIVPYITDLVWETADRLNAQEKNSDLAKFPEEDPNPILRTTKDGMIIYANPASEHLMSAWKCMIGDILPQPYRELVSDTSRTEAVTRVEISEEGRLFEMIMTPFTDQDYLNIYAIDITGRKRAETALEKAHEWLLEHERLSAIGAVAGGMAHDLRNPLGSIKNAIYFLKISLKDQDKRVLDTISMMEKDISVSDKVIRDLLEFARPKAPVRQRVFVKNIVNIALERAQVPMNIKVIRNLKSQVNFLADPELLSIALKVLIDNALHAMPDGGRLRIGCVVKNAPQRIELSVSDTGVGIPPDNIERIFDPLFTTKSIGTGLGLGLSKTLVEMHGGTIDVTSKMGKGSTFTLRIPTERIYGGPM